ncbi:MAG: tRNA (adenosine(37)-N6)-threonylcarbamoyltransferase complex dimerization subunit type 1 TsaB [Lachnospiraceae bacterium]|nr:tRNA (adenosine(37)-N6)-threonylcarbamoyltransferase complex dimerization subunit type 1 TsaB [Lachnospiraceae bacterium]
MILAIDSSSLVASVALVDENTVIAEYTMNLKKTHSQTLLPMINEIFKMTGIDKKSLSAIAVAQGPGSFTGLRIGAATAKGLALALDLPIVGVSTIEMMAYNFNHCNKLICPIMDARRNQVYTGIYECEKDELKQVVEDVALSIEELIEKIGSIGKEVIFIGDGIPVFQEVIDQTLKIPHYYANQHLNRQQSSSLGVLGLKKLAEGKAVKSDYFAPVYMRMSQAERERLENGKENEN